MKGMWFWPSEPKDQAKTLRRIRQEDELTTIIAALAKGQEGLSNAEIDNLLKNNSQWRTSLHLTQLTALGFIEYKVQFFGGPGEYNLTDLGKSVISWGRAENPAKIDGSLSRPGSL